MPSTRPRETTDLERLQRFFASLLCDEGCFAKVTVSVQQGKVGMVHVDRSYTADTLPLPGE